MNRLLQFIVGGLLAVLVGVLLVHWLAASDPVAVAKAEAGPGASISSFISSDGLFGGDATVRVRPEDKAGKSIEIRLYRPFWSRHWRKR